MVCVPCIVIPVLLYIWHRFLQPIMLKFWNPWAKVSHYLYTYCWKILTAIILQTMLKLQQLDNIFQVETDKSGAGGDTGKELPAGHPDPKSNGANGACPFTKLTNSQSSEQLKKTE